MSHPDGGAVYPSNGSQEVAMGSLTQRIESAIRDALEKPLTGPGKQASG